MISYCIIDAKTMALKNSNTVALERRYDLSTLFCMIGRHGPAVAMFIIAMLSVLAAFIIYRTLRGQRRKASAAADNKKLLGAEKDAAVGPPGQLPSQEESYNPTESTGIVKHHKYEHGYILTKHYSRSCVIVL